MLQALSYFETHLSIQLFLCYYCCLLHHLKFLFPPFPLSLFHCHRHLFSPSGVIYPATQKFLTSCSQSQLIVLSTSMLRFYLDHSFSMYQCNIPNFVYICWVFLLVFRFSFLYFFRKIWFLSSILDFMYDINSILSTPTYFLAAPFLDLFGIYYFTLNVFTGFMSQITIKIGQEFHCEIMFCFVPRLMKVMYHAAVEQ